jgi:hypothetical protein
VLLDLLGTGVGTAVTVRWDPSAVWIVVVLHGCALDQFDGDTSLVSLDDACDFSGKPDVHASRLEVLLPSTVEFAKLREHNHGREIACDTQIVRWKPHTVCGARAETFEDDTRHVGSFVSSSEEESNHGHGDSVGKFLGEKEHLEKNLDGDKCEEELKPANDLEHSIEPSDLFLMPCEEFRGENVAPKNVIFAKGDLQTSIRIHRLVTLSLLVGLQGRHGDPVLQT